MLIQKDHPWNQQLISNKRKLAELTSLKDFLEGL